MNRRLWNNLVSIAALSLLMVFFQNCSDVRLSPGARTYKSTDTNLNFCTTKAGTIKSNLKFIFIQDHSGSNKQRYDDQSNPLPGTDPDGARRFGPLIQFIQNFQEDPYIHWSMIEFNSNSRVVKDFTNDKQNFLNFVVDRKNRVAELDGGGTNYLSAMGQVSNLINRDIEAGRSADPLVSSTYVLFFISDGSPIVSGALQNSDTILSRVTTLMSIEEDEKLLVEGLQLNVGYYFEDPVDPGARELLNNMSLEGKGDFLEFGAGQNIDFSRFAIPTRKMRFDLKEFWVVNTNAIWDGDAYKADDDGDGLANERELALGSNPAKADSDDNGVTDFVEYYIQGQTHPCKDASCNPAGADPYTSCRSLELPSGAARYADKDRDFLNDCEEKLLGSDMNDPDSNHDYIPDRLALMNGIKISESSNAGYLDPDIDGLTNYEELKYNTPNDVPNDRIKGGNPLAYSGGLVSEGEDNDCYRFSISRMKFFKDSDQVRIYLMENTKSLKEKRLMRTAQKPLTKSTFFFLDGDFQ